jgi:hypothetical protein
LSDCSNYCYTVADDKISFTENHILVKSKINLYTVYTSNLAYTDSGHRYCNYLHRSTTIVNKNLSKSLPDNYPKTFFSHQHSKVRFS